MSYSSEAISNRAWPQFKPSILVSAIALFSLGAVQAAPDIEQAPRLSNEDYGVELYPNDNAIAVPVGEAGFYPSGAVRISSVKNLFHKDDKGSESDGKVTRIQVMPKLDLIAEGSKSVYWALLRGDFRSHSGDGDLDRADTSDFRLRGFSHFDFDNRNRLDIELSHSQLSEELGTGRTRDAIDFANAENSDTYNLNRVGVTYSYGNPRSRGELVAGVALGTLEYTENEVDLKKFNRDMSILWGRFSYKLTGKTTLFSRLDHRSYEYKDDDNSLNNRRDRDATSLTLGANWNSTGLLYGNAFVSVSDSEYTERESNNGSDTTWGGNLHWAIRSYSDANLYVRQFVDDVTSSESSETQTTSTVGVRWKHGWTGRFNTTVAGYSSYDKLEGKKTNERQVISLEGRLSIRRWLNLLIGVSTDQLDSEGIESTRDELYVGLEGNL